VISHEGSVEGSDRSRVALGPRSTAGRLRVRVASCSSPPAAITNTLAGYRTAQPSDSPRASRYASRWPPFRTAQATARRADVGDDPETSPPPVSAPLAHGSGRGTPSRAASLPRRGQASEWAFPLDCVPMRSAPGEALAETRRERSNFIRPSTENLNMPICKSCEHRGEDHNWKVQRVRGHCMSPQCICSRYVPLTDRPRPVNRLMGRLLYKKRR
jgi:hypothetical protein